MLLDETQLVRLSRWIARNFFKTVMLLSLAGNAYQYKQAAEERAEARKFALQVYNNEVQRSHTWEEIILTLRGSSR